MTDYPRLIRCSWVDRVVCATSPTEGFVVCYYGKPPPEWASKVADVIQTWTFSDNDETLSGPVGGYKYTLTEPSWFEEGWEVLRTDGAWCERVEGEGPFTTPRVYRRKARDLTYPVLMRSRLTGALVCATSEVVGVLVREGKENRQWKCMQVGQETGDWWEFYRIDRWDVYDGTEIDGYTYALETVTGTEEVLRSDGSWYDVRHANPSRSTTPRVYRTAVKAVPEAVEPKCEWRFACQPEDFDFRRILREAPATARVVRIRLLGREIVAFREEAYKRALNALGGLPIGMYTWRDRSYRISRTGQLELYRTWEKEEKSHWRVTLALPFGRSHYARIVQWLANADAAELKAKEEAERKARRVEVSVTTA